MPERARRVAVLAHCHLNVNTKVHGLADYSGIRTDVLEALVRDGVGIVQLPCPEATFLGMKRWGMTREQYDTVAYRHHCEEILRPVVDALTELSADHCSIEAVLGVDGSPSCGIARTCTGYAGGEIEGLFAEGISPVARATDGFGVFMEVFRSMLEEVGLNVEFRGIEESPENRG
jgi:predicted secreted protein